jgi:hypothetical protein
MDRPTFALVKRNKRFIIERDGEPVYSPPDFLRPKIVGRDPLHELARQMNEQGYSIGLIVAFETRLRP